MLGWFIRVLFVMAGAITSLFVAKDALNFAVIQMVIMVVLFTLMITLVAFWPNIKRLFTRKK